MAIGDFGQTQANAMFTGWVEGDVGVVVARLHTAIAIDAAKQVCLEIEVDMVGQVPTEGQTAAADTDGLSPASASAPFEPPVMSRNEPSLALSAV